MSCHVASALRTYIATVGVGGVEEGRGVERGGVERNEQKIEMNRREK